MNLTLLSIIYELLKRITEIVNKGLLVRYSKARGVWYTKVKASNDHTLNEESAKLLLDDNNYSKGFNNLDDLFSDLEI